MDMGYLATESQADLEYSRNVGFDNQDRAWILSDRDVWYPNPFYTGPKQLHPEDDHYEDDDQAYENSPVFAIATYDNDQEIPF